MYLPRMVIIIVIIIIIMVFLAHADMSRVLYANSLLLHRHIRYGAFFLGRGTEPSLPENILTAPEKNCSSNGTSI